MIDPDGVEWLTYAEASAALPDVSVGRLKVWVHRGKVETHRTGRTVWLHMGDVREAEAAWHRRVEARRARLV